jgi:hypothetical protein
LASPDDGADAMSEPWIRVYAADMRGDPGVRNLSPAMRYALIQAWDLAKNGPGKVAELRSNDGRAMRERELRDLSNVAAAETRRMFERWAKLDLCQLVDEGDDVLCTFPNLAKRQGIDATAAERKRRERERRRHGHVTAESREVSRQKSRSMSRHVTGENQSTEERRTKEEKPSVPATPPPPSRKPDEVWDAVLVACDFKPETTSERGKTNRAVKELKEAGATATEIAQRAKAMQQKWPNIRLTPTTLSGNWGAFAVNGTTPKRSMAEIDKLAAEHGWNGADVQTPEPEDLPF